MAVWKDPLLPKIKIPDDLEHTEFTLGSAKYHLLPKQFEFMASPEVFTGFISGYGGGKTKTGVIKAAYLSMTPGNLGIIGRLNGPDLEATTEKDLLAFLHEAELLKEAPNSRNKRALVHCIDPQTGENLGYTSEISFQHLDDPDHLRGRHIGWFWIDEGSECSASAWKNLIGRLRLPTFKGRFKGMVTGNPEGHNWIYDFFFNQEILENVICGAPGCRLSDKDCNRNIRLKRRGIHCTSYENYFLPKDTLELQLASYNPEERARYLEGSFDVFEGQIFKEFDHGLHVLV